MAAGALALAGTTLAFAGAASAAQAAPAASQQAHDSHHKTTLHLDLAPMPTGTVSTGYNADGTMFIQVNATGFTPGSAHWVDVFHNGMANPFGSLRGHATLVYNPVAHTLT